MNFIYTPTKRRMLEGTFDWVGTNHKIVLVDYTYSYSVDHSSLADLAHPTPTQASSVVTYSEDIRNRSLVNEGGFVVASGEWRVKMIDTTADATVKSLIIVDENDLLVAYFEDLPTLPIMPVQLRAGELYITSDPDIGGWFRL